MSYMNRGEGLVQRRNVAQTVTMTAEEEDREEKGKYEEEEDRDSKETRLTLMEEILLLGLKDREVLGLIKIGGILSKFECILLV